MTQATKRKRRSPAEPPTEKTRPPRRSARRVVVAGASGFLGRQVVALLLERDYQVVALARHLDASSARDGVIQVVADAATDAWWRWCDGCTAAINLVGIIRETREITFDRAHRVAAARMVEACRELRIARLVHVSALGARETSTVPYQRTKWQGEEAVRASGVAWTILRPSVIFGAGDGFTTALAGVLRAAPVYPVFGDGTVKLQPIAVEEVAHAIVASLDVPESHGRVIDLGGPEALTYDEVVRRTAHALGKTARLLHLPLGLARRLVALASILPRPPITTDELDMLLQGSTCDTSVSRVLFGVPTRRFEGPVWLGRGPAAAPTPSSQALSA